jgi:hypothetical protein
MWFLSCSLVVVFSGVVLRSWFASGEGSLSWKGIGASIVVPLKSVVLRKGDVQEGGESSLM